MGRLKPKSKWTSDLMECRKCGRVFDLTPPPVQVDEVIEQPQPQIILTDGE